MKKIILLFITIVLCLNCYSQISFEKGYYIDNSNQKTECFIKNYDWKNNPIEIEYKLSENAEQKKTTIKSIKEFGLDGISKYCRHKVKIDRSSNNINLLSDVKHPIFNEEELFLKVIVEGKANLYSFEDGNLRRYFYKNDTTAVEQLIFKKYLYIDKTNYLHSDKVIGNNNRYKQQLWNNLKCSTITRKNVERVEYKKRDLVNLFVKYNGCNIQGYTNLYETKKRSPFHLNIRPGLNSSSFSLQNDYTLIKNIDFDNKLSFRIGIEVEYIMSFNKNKWAIILEPTYQYYKSENEVIYIQNSIETKTTNIVVDYSSIEIPIGIRYYSFINDDSKLFFNLLYVFDSPISDSLYSEERKDLLDLKIATTKNNLAFGLGYKYIDKYSLELRIHTSRDLLNDNPTWNSEYNTFSVIFGYSIF